MPEDDSVAVTEKLSKVKESTTQDVVAKIQGQFNEEKWTRIAAKDVTISRFKFLDSTLEEVREKEIIEQLELVAREHLEEYEASLSARYFLGMLSLKAGNSKNICYLESLLEQFQKLSKWVVVNYLCDKILKKNENRVVLKTKAEALEKLGHTKEAIPVLEKLARIDRKNPDIVFKYAEAVIADDLDKGVQFYKQAAEIYAKNLKFDKLKVVWGRLVELIPEDFSFYRKIERTLIGHRRKDMLAELYVQLTHYYIKQEKIDFIIIFCKKILECNVNYSRFKNELIRSYREKYKDHSLLEDFIKYSGLLDTRKSVINSIQNFETNIVFDKEHYVHHRSWGVGKIKELNTQEMVINFKNKLNHKMHIEMALKSLKPLKDKHFLVRQHENFEDLKSLFETNLVEFFKLLLSSFGNRLSLSEIKSYLSEVYISEKIWSKWWPKTRISILKDSLIGISPQRRDIIELRDNPVAHSEILIEKFQVAQTFEDKVLIAVDALKEGQGNIEALEYMQPTFKDGLKLLEVEKRLQSLWLLELIDDCLGEEEISISQEITDSCVNNIKAFTLGKAVEIALTLKSSDILKKYVKLLREEHIGWSEIYLELLFALPVKFHKFLILDLITEENNEILNKFFVRLNKKFASYSELFLAVFKGLVLGQWDIIYCSPDQYILSLFRLGKILPKIEAKGTKQKSIFKDIFLGNNKDIFFAFVDKHIELGSLKKLIFLFREVSFIPDVDKSKFTQYFMEKRANEFSESQTTSIDLSIDNIIKKSEIKGSGIASQNAQLRMRGQLENLINIEIPNNSKEIGIAQEKGDLRENAEYKAAMEKQIILQSAVTKLERELKDVIPIVGVLISKDKISLGCKVKLHDEKNNDMFVYSVMDRWDADIDNGIISYQSPLGKALLGHEVGDKIIFGYGNEEQHLKVIDINSAINSEGLLI